MFCQLVTSHLPFGTQSKSFSLFIYLFIYLFILGGLNDAALLNMHIKYKYEIYSSMYNWIGLSLACLL